MADLTRPHGCIGCSIIIVMIFLGSLAASLPSAIRAVRYSSGVTLGCGTDQIEEPPVLDRVVYVIPNENCWTDWVTIPNPHRYSVSTDASIAEQLWYTDGTTEVWQDTPGSSRTLEKDLAKVRFKNESNSPITITIRFTRN